MRIREAVRKPAATIEVDHDIQEAASLMNADGVGALVVTDGGRPVGIVTDRDIVVRAVARGIPADGRIDSVMSLPLVTVDAESDLRDAVRLFQSHPFRRLPIVEAGAVIGMLAVDDLLVHLASDLGHLVRPVAGQVLFGYPEPIVPATA